MPMMRNWCGAGTQFVVGGGVGTSYLHVAALLIHASQPAGGMRECADGLPVIALQDFAIL